MALIIRIRSNGVVTNTHNAQSLCLSCFLYPLSLHHHDLSGFKIIIIRITKFACVIDLDASTFYRRLLCIVAFLGLKLPVGEAKGFLKCGEISWAASGGWSRRWSARWRRGRRRSARWSAWRWSSTRWWGSRGRERTGAEDGQKLVTSQSIIVKEPVQGTQLPWVGHCQGYDHHGDTERWQRWSQSCASYGHSHSMSSSRSRTREATSQRDSSVLSVITEDLAVDTGPPVIVLDSSNGSSMMIII